MASGASPLENELVAFVEGHPETFSPQDVVNLRRSIIYRFGYVDGGRGNDPNMPGLGVLANDILTHISKKINGTSMNTIQDVQYALNQFELSVEFVNAFLERLCNTERSYNPGGYVSGGSTNRSECEKQRQWIHPVSRPLYAGQINIFEFVKRKINEYNVKVLKLWADVLIREGKITQAAIDAMQARVVSAKDGYEQKMRELYENPSGIAFRRNNLNDSVLLEFLTLFHVATLVQMTTQYSNLGPLDHIVGSVISQFVPIRIVNGYGPIPTGNHASELNVVNLTCVVVAKPYTTREAYIQLPVMAYLSSDALDQCVKSVGHFPTTDEFLSKRMIEKAA
ncbi:MAG: hypothetical protein EBU84_22315, partial [Actinobacteria bacterium]|nr:hypothetical protein [Actinomycetota bacterium]